MRKFLSHIKHISIWGVFFISLVLWYQNIYHNTKDYPEGESSIAFVLDVSKSMNVADIWSKSRLRVAKEYIVNIMDTQKGYDFSLAIFAWESQRVLPFTRDVSLFSTLLFGIDSTNILKQWTNIEAGLGDALAAFGSHRTGTIIVLTDGDESEISMSSDLISALKKQDIEIIIVWVWTEEWWYVPTGDRFAPYKIYEGQRVIAQLNEWWLKQLARTLDGEYYTYSEDINIESIPHTRWNTNNFSYVFVIFCILWIVFLWSVFREIYYKKI